jgi:hypothetical protein
MYARVTQFEIDPVRMGADEALKRFKQLIVPRLEAQIGYAGAYALLTPEGRGELITFWTTAEAAEETLSSGFWSSQVSEFLTFMRQAPGREHYEVVYAKVPAQVAV